MRLPPRRTERHAGQAERFRRSKIDTSSIGSCCH
jgi:hypothetical protein